MLAEGGQPGVKMALLAAMVFCGSVGQSSCATDGRVTVTGRDVAVPWRAACAQGWGGTPHLSPAPAPCSRKPVPGHASRLLAAALVMERRSFVPGPCPTAWPCWRASGLLGSGGGGALVPTRQRLPAASPRSGTAGSLAQGARSAWQEPKYKPPSLKVPFPPGRCHTNSLSTAKK